jgi:hypothetical protein
VLRVAAHDPVEALRVERGSRRTASMIAHSAARCGAGSNRRAESGAAWRAAEGTCERGHRARARRDQPRVLPRPRRRVQRTRNAPWAGFAPLADGAARAARARLRVLDVGCGNGRFARYLAQALAPRARRALGRRCERAAARRARARGAARAQLAAVRRGGSDERPALRPVRPRDAARGDPRRARTASAAARCSRRARAGSRRAARSRSAPGGAADANGSSTGIPTVPGRYADRLLTAGARRSADSVGLRRRRCGALFPLLRRARRRELHGRLPLVLEQRYRADGRGGDQNEYFVFRAR